MMKLNVIIASVLMCALSLTAVSAFAQTPTAPAGSSAAVTATPTGEDSPRHPCYQERMSICKGETWGHGAGKCLSENYAQLGALCKARVDKFRANHPNAK